MDNLDALILAESRKVDALLHGVYDLDITTKVRNTGHGTYTLRKTIHPRMPYDNTYNTYLNAYNAIMTAHLGEQSKHIYIMCAEQRAEGKSPRKYGHVFEWRILIN